MEKIEKGILAVINGMEADDATTFVLTLLQQHAVEFAEWCIRGMSIGEMFYDPKLNKWSLMYSNCQYVTTIELHEKYLSDSNKKQNGK